jgi:RNA polymerase sigma factor (sigma-70 family)
MRRERPFKMTGNDEKEAREFVRQSYLRYGPELRRYLHRRLPNDQDVRELAQEVWARLLRVRNTSEILEPLAYLYQTARHVLAEYRMRERRDRVSIDSDAADHATENPDHVAKDEVIDEVARRAEWERLAAALPRTYRRVLILKVTHGKSYEEIARDLQFSPKTVEQYFFRAMTALRKCKRDG